METKNKVKNIYIIICTSKAHFLLWSFSFCLLFGSFVLQSKISMKVKGISIIRIVPIDTAKSRLVNPLSLFDFELHIERREQTESAAMSLMKIKVK